MKTVPLDNDWEHVWPVSRHNTATGEKEPAAGLTNLFARFSATDGGLAIHADVDKTLAERASADAEYFAVTDGTALRAHLAVYVGQVVYEVFGDGVNLLYSVPRRVVQFRRP